jgi:4-hydroxy-tetrahydrodipicolinate synthase
VADVAPAECVALWEACRAAELDRARELNGRLLPLARFDMTPKLVQYFKAAMDERGLTGGDCRPPRMPLTAEEREAMHAALRTLDGVPA